MCCVWFSLFITHVSYFSLKYTYIPIQNDYVVVTSLFIVAPIVGVILSSLFCYAVLCVF